MGSATGSRFIAAVLSGVTAGVITLAISLLLLQLGIWIHGWKEDRRIIKQAKAWRVWDKPELLGGRALELKAWQDFKIKRKPGEMDASLRRRYMKRKKEFIERVKQDLPKFLEIPPDILFGKTEPEKDQKQEGEAK